ncbi:MAG TPA: precorrin-8X methylmutase, partial [Clostridia bacterium]|nr:precorrin-8X methylmutase [Clostridia bacterium]
MNVVWEPTAIESKSMRIIGELLDHCPHEGAERDIVKRVVHTTGDPAIVDKIKFHQDATRVGVKALREGANIFTDVNMLRVGVNSKSLQELGG